MQRLFTDDANVRNVKTFFSVQRAKFETRVAAALRAAQCRSALEHDQALEVLALGEVHRHRMIGRGAEARVDEAVDAGVEAGAGDDLVEQVGARCRPSTRR